MRWLIGLYSLVLIIAGVLAMIVWKLLDEFFFGGDKK
jgi:hypothetical protein